MASSINHNCSDFIEINVDALVLTSVCSLLKNFKLEFFVFFGCRIICCCIKYVFSVNKISTLADFVNCLNLEELYIRKNEIRDLAEIRHLKK